MSLGGHIDIVNTLINPTFSNANNFDLVISTDASTQAIHLGSVSLSNSTIKITNQEVRMESDLVLRKQIQASCNDSVTFPGFTWHTNSNTGLYRIAPNKIGFSAGGLHVMGLSNGGVNIAGNLNVDGTLTCTSTNIQTGTAGLRNVDNRNIDVASGCNLRVIQGQILAPSNDGLTGLPTYSWSNDSNTGMYHYAQSSIGFKASNVHVVEVSKTGVNVIGDINFSGSLKQFGLEYQTGTPGLSNIGNDIRVLANSNLVIQSGQILGWSNDIVTKPAYSWSNNSNTGMYHITSNVIGFTSGGIHVMSLSNGLLDLVGDINFSGTLKRQGVDFQSGTPGISNIGNDVRVLANSNLVIQDGQILAWSNDIVTKPAYSWSNNSNTGMYHISNNVIGFASGGAHVMSLSNGVLDLVGDINFSGALRRQGINFQSGTPGLSNSANEVRILANSNLVIQNGQILAWSNDIVTKPAYSWSNNSNTGMYHISNNVIGFTSGGAHVMSLSNGVLDLVGDINFSGALRRQGADFQSTPGLGNLGNEVRVLANSNLVIQGGQVLGWPNDTVANPAYSWSNNSNTGMYKVSNNVIGFSANGKQVLALGESSTIINNSLVPSKNEACDLGTPSQRWGNIYASGSALMLGDSRIVNDSGIISASTYGVFEPIKNRLLDALLGNSRFEYLGDDYNYLKTLVIPEGDGNMIVLPPNYTISLLDSTIGWTLEFTIKRNYDSSNTIQKIIACQAPMTNFYVWKIFYRGDLNRFEFQYHNGESIITPESTNEMLLESWYSRHFAITFENGTNKRIRLFFGGILQWEHACTSLPYYNLPLVFGSQRNFTEFLSVNPACWYDANILLPSSTSISTLPDLSGNNRAMYQYNSSYWPYYSLLESTEMPSVQFVYNNDSLNFQCLGASITEFTVAFVVNLGNIGYFNTYNIFTTSPWTSNGFALNIQYSRMKAHVGNQNYDLFNVSKNTKYLIIFTFKDGQGQLYLNGTKQTSISFNQTMVNLTNIKLGGNDDYNSWNTSYCELFVFGSQLSLIDISKLETYLASKWWSASTNPLPLTHPYKSISMAKTLKFKKDWYKVIIEVADAINDYVGQDNGGLWYLWNVRLTSGAIFYVPDFSPPSDYVQLGSATTGTTVFIGWPEKTVKKGLDIDKLSTNSFRSSYLYSCFLIKSSNIENNSTFILNIASLQGYDVNFAPKTLTSCCPQGSGILVISPYFLQSGLPAYYNKYVCHLSYNKQSSDTAYTYTTNLIASHGLSVAVPLTSSTSSQLNIKNETGNNMTGYIATFVNVGPIG